MQHKQLPDVVKIINPEMLNSMVEIQQSRSRFQLEKFVLNQHDTDEMKYYQCLLEITSLYYSLKNLSLDAKKIELEIKKLRSTGDEIDEIEAQKKELGLEQMQLGAVGQFRELEYLMHLYESFPIKYTREQIELAQPQYWDKRLNRQATMDALGGPVSPHLEALRQIGAIELDLETRSIKDSDSYKELLESKEENEILYLEN